MVKFLCLLPVLMFLTSCSSTNNKPILIKFSADSSSIIFSNIDRAGLLQLKNNTVNDSVSNGIISVLQISSEKETVAKETLVTGELEKTDSTIVFIPNKPFVKGADYLVVTYLNASFGDIKKIVSGKLSYGVKPIQQLLSR